MSWVWLSAGGLGLTLGLALLIGFIVVILSLVNPPPPTRAITTQVLTAATTVVDPTVGLILDSLTQTAAAAFAQATQEYLTQAVTAETTQI